MDMQEGNSEIAYLDCLTRLFSSKSDDNEKDCAVCLSTEDIVSSSYHDDYVYNVVFNNVSEHITDNVYSDSLSNNVSEHITDNGYSDSLFNNVCEHIPDNGYSDSLSNNVCEHIPDNGYSDSLSNDLAYEAIQNSEFKHNSDFINTHYCLFCKKPQSRIQRHLVLQHKNEAEVKEKINNNDPKKFLLLINRGDLSHNLEALKNGGKIVVLRRPAEFVSKHDFVPCPYCLGFVKKSDLYQHSRQRCHLRPNNFKKQSINPSTGRGLLFRSLMILGDIDSEVKQEFIDSILPDLKLDEIGQVAVHDNIIMLIGQKLFIKHGQRQSKLIRSKMRELARLVICLKKYSVMSLKDACTPEKFDTIVQAVKDLCSYKEDDGINPDLPFHTFEKSSLALALGHGIKKSAQIIWGISVRNNDSDSEEKAYSFLKLYDSEWTESVSSHALKSKRAIANEKQNDMPLTEDLITLKSKIDSVIQENTVILTKNMESANAFQQLSEAIAARILLFNRRRAMESTAISVANFTACITQQDIVLKDLTDQLSDFEKNLVKKLRLCFIYGKKNRKVPIILLPEVFDGLQLLLRAKNCQNMPIRKSLYILNDNKGRVIRGGNSLKKMCALTSDLKRPDLINSRTLRKHFATLSQILHIEGEPLEWVLNHLGHTEDVHRAYYRMQSNLLEKTKVAKLLYLAENGQLSRFYGKTIDEIDIVDEEDMNLYMQGTDGYSSFGAVGSSLNVKSNSNAVGSSSNVKSNSNAVGSSSNVKSNSNAVASRSNNVKSNSNAVASRLNVKSNSNATGSNYCENLITNRGRKIYAPDRFF